MIIGIFGESCTGKSTIAGELARRTAAKIYTGKDYLKLAKNEAEARNMFISLLKNNVDTPDIFIYVISEKEHLNFLPDDSIRIYMTASLDIIKERFAKRMNGNMPPPVATMLENKHGMFNNEKYDFKFDTADDSGDDICEKILAYVKEKCDG